MIFMGYVSFREGTVLGYPFGNLSCTVVTPTQVGCFAWSCASGPDLVGCQGGRIKIGRRMLSGVFN